MSWWLNNANLQKIMYVALKKINRNVYVGRELDWEYWNQVWLGIFGAGVGRVVTGVLDPSVFTP